MLKEFKEFISKGSVMDLAIGVIIGGAFSKIVSSLVDDIIMPLVGLLLGGADISNYFVTLDGGKYATLAEAQEAGAATLNYGVFLNRIIDFLIIAFVLFLIIKSINKARALTKKPEAEAAPTTKVCPYCKSTIDINATRCPNCTSELK
ncbi:MAG: large conductance mechanosensitive channel protein MscL [Eubacteriales bacterium]|uniref:large conductance mechanosensitive channel protein MscL n=1 Tax=Fenollaria sp. TaxID=1965292 RepID=UPI002A74CE0F|nr:large conductance mechanosensitive channel protein MscL [Fenollaria sp.]MDD7340151.1 large conductance mechanosensitive channel protein MscL [Eubacteriales bacterium]MDY3105575.1 large conductance mechanosensitive channel protein MscL [Fenollaria sp.]